MMGARRLAAAAVVVMTLSGCGLRRPAPQPPDLLLPDGYDAPAPAPSAAREWTPDWWTEFGDPGLDRAVRLALESNPGLRGAAYRLEAAAAQARIAGAALKPSADLSLSGSRRKQNFIGFPIPGRENEVLSTRFTTFGVSLETRWEADLWGRLRAGKRAGLAEFEAAGALYDAARLSLEGQTAKAWFAAAEAALQEELARETVDIFRRSLERVEARYRRGLRPSLDVRLARSNLAAAEAALHQRRDLAARARRQLRVLLGATSDPPDLPRAARLPELPGPPPPGLPSELLLRRPDILAAQFRLVQAGARVDEARAALLPRFQLTASGGTSTRELKDLVDRDFSVWSLLAGVLQPVFQGGRLRAGVQVSEARYRELAEDYVRAVVQALTEVENALESEAALARREEALRRAAEQARAARELAEDRYRRGLADVLAVLESQRRALEAESGVLRVRRARLDNRVDLILALGGPPPLEPAAASPVSGAPPGNTRTRP